MSNVSKLIAELSPEKRELLGRQLREKRKSKPTERVVTPRDSSSAHAPLSFHQERLWFLDQYESGSPLYNLAAAVRLTGPLQRAALEQSFNEIIARHESLRTVFSMKNGQLVQSIDPVRYAELPLRELSGMTVVQQDAEVQRLIEADSRVSFDLARGPLVRLSLLRLAEDKHIALLAMHHIISDGWSIGVFIRELADCYEAFVEGGGPSLTPLPIQYPDFAIWQREWLQGEVLETELAYWKQQLSGTVPMLQLPTDRPRPPAQSSNGAKHPFVLSSSWSFVLKGFCQDEKVTVFMLLVAALQALLHRYSGQEDIVVGTPIAGRYPVETEPLIGYFVNTLALRTTVTDQMSVRQLLGAVREMAMEAFAHQKLPFEKIVDAIDPARDLSHTPLLQVWFVLHNTPAPKLNLRGLEFESLEVDAGTAKFDLSLSMVETPAGLRGAWIYNTDLFNPETVVRISRQFQLLLEGIVKDPDRSIASLPLLTRPERESLIAECSSSSVARPTDLCLHHLFEAQVERTPEAVAIELGSDRLTYRQLNQRANQLAHYLQSLNVGPEKLVGLCMERSLDVILGLLATLKAGGVYVPLDPQNPEERLEFMMQDARAPVLLTQSWLISELPAYAAASDIVCIDSDWDTIAQESDANVESTAQPENLAYVIYTSGSSGKPKGVCISHRAAVDHFITMQQEFGLTAADRVLQFSSFGFDVSLEQILPTLFSGATLVLRGDELWTAADFRQQIQKLKLSVVNPPTAYWHQLAQEIAGCEESFSSTSLRLMIVGGDLLLQEPVKLWQSCSTQATLVNAYGPTETTITASLFVIPPGFCDGPTGSRIPIGRALPNRSMFVLDRCQEIVPVGIPGELCIGGPLLARGYLNRPDLTVESFCPDPFSQTPGARLYRTGDLVRYLADGNIEFLGRVDDQVKIRGYRIELGEVEAALVENPHVREAVVVPQPDVTGEKRLVAYLVGDQDQLRKLGELRAFLKKKLPEYMLPAAFVALDKLPLSPNGKVDRARLPVPSESRPEVEASFAAPRTIVEDVLAQMWADILGVERVGVNDDFFDLGGHSLLATQVVTRVRETFQIELPLRRLFESPTIGGLAESIESELRAGHSQKDLPVQKRTRNEHLPLSYAQQRLWYLNQLNPDSGFYNLLTMVELSGPLDVEIFKQSLTEVIRRHEVLRTTFVVVNGEPEQRISPPARAASLSVRNLTSLAEEKQQILVAQFAREESTKPFDLQNGPLLRAFLVALDERRHVLLLTLHHMVCDAWSLGIFLREVAALYEGFASGQPSPLNDLTIQYADYALWEKDWLQGERMQKQLDYWQRQLAAAPAVLSLPADRSRPPIQTYRGQNITFTIPNNVLEQVKNLSRAAGTTLFMTLLGAWQVLLARYTDQFDVSVGSPIAGRNNSEAEQLIGFFVNSLVMRTDLTGDPTFTEVLHRVREVSLNAYMHQDLPFEKLVEALQPERQGDQNPLFQVMFILQNTPMPSLEFAGLKLRPVDFDSGTAKFDLTLDLAEAPEGLKGWLEYSSDLFEAGTIERLARHFQTLLSDAVQHPERSISELQLLASEERAQVVEEWNRTERVYEGGQCIHELFEAQAARTPEQIAVVSEQEALSYEELNARANQLAHYLRRMGVGPEVLAGLMLERSVAMVVALLGVLKAGGAYVPLDPHYPAERLRYMVRDAGVAVLVTEQRWLAGLGAEALPQVITIENAAEQIGKENKSNVSNETDARSLAYVIYTSGSTGQPKGAMNTHGAVRNRLLWMQEQYQLGTSDAVLQKTAFSFDVSVWEFFWPLLMGARLVLARPGGERDSEYLVETMMAHQVTTVHFVPSLLQVLLEERGLERCASLRQVFCSGEVLSLELQRRFFARCGAELHNLYGPTEAAIDVSYWRCEREETERRTVPIGRPIANLQLYILDRAGQPVPVGVSGELYLSGVGVGRGYHQRPELTAERFVPNAFSGETGGRSYRTGDLARFLPGGEIEYLGRLDEQVKIRGFRIELGEVEAALSRHEAVAETVVVARPAPGNSHLQLLAYVVGRAGAEVNRSELRQYLRQALPDYMVPAAFVVLEAMPLTANGKLDRKALPAPELEQTANAVESDVPRTPTEEIVVQIWQEVLGLEQVGMQESFFELGGHSLLAMRLIARLHEAFEVKLSLHNFLDEFTVRGLAEAIDRLRNDGASEVLPELSAVVHDGHPPLSFAQQRLWFLNQFDPENPAFIIPAYVQINGPLNAAVLERCFNEIVRRHEALRSTFATVQGEPVQTIVSPGPVTITQLDLRGMEPSEREREAQRWIREETQRPFNLAEWPLFRIVLLRLKDEEYNLLLSMHHIISDGRSCEILLDEIIALYEAFSTDRESPLTDLSVQYSDFASYQRKLLQGKLLEDHLSYWRKQLSGAPRLFTLPSDRPRPMTQSHRGANFFFYLPSSLPEPMRNLSRQENATLFMTALAAFEVLLYFRTKQDDVVIAIDDANRNHVKTERLIGFFVNQLVVRNDLSGNPTFRELLRQVRKNTIEAYAHQDLPFDKLVEVLQPERNLQHAPLCQVKLSFEKGHTPPQQPRDLKFRRSKLITARLSSI